MAETRTTNNVPSETAGGSAHELMITLMTLVLWSLMPLAWRVMGRNPPLQLPPICENSDHSKPPIGTYLRGVYNVFLG